MKERWKTIEGFEPYEVSNFGNIRNGERQLKPFVKYKKRKYLAIKMFCNIKQKYVNKYVHRLVAMAFIKNPLNKPQVNHKDGNPANNYFDNLEFCTNQENRDHAVRTGLQASRITGNCKISVKNAILIQEYHSSGKYKIKELAKMFGVVKSTIYYALKFSFIKE